MLQHLLRGLALSPLSSYLENNNFLSLLGLCSAFDEANAGQQTEDCLGIEFHHANSSLDAFFYGKSKTLKSGKFYSPAWLTKHFAFVEVQGLRRHFLDGHYFELDKRGDGYSLTGMFQAYEKSVDSLSNIANISSYLRAVDFLDEKNCWEFESDLELMQCTFGCPYQIGLMVGRGKSVKLVSKLVDSEEKGGAFDACRFFIQEKIANASTIGGLDVSVLAKLISAAVETCNVKISLDYNLDKVQFYPRLGIELGIKNNGKLQDSAAIQSILKASRIDEQVMQSFLEVHSKLPCGVKLRSLYHSLILCNVTHVKVILSPKGQELKTYIAVHARKTSDPPLDGIDYLA